MSNYTDKRQVFFATPGQEASDLPNVELTSNEETMFTRHGVRFFEVGGRVASGESLENLYPAHMRELQIRTVGYDAQLPEFSRAAQ